MTTEQLTMAVGLKAACKLAILKSRLADTVAVRQQTTDFDGATPTIGPVGECPICHDQHAEGVLHG